MKDWVECRIGDVTSLQQGLCINSNSRHLLDNTGYPLLRITDLINGTEIQFINKHKVPKRFIAKPEDLIYTRTGQVGQIFKERTGIIHNNCFKIIPNSKVDKDYLFWFLKTKAAYDYANSVASGAAQPDLGHIPFKSMPFKFPHLSIQKKIASILSAYDELIENNNRRIVILEKMAEEIYREWFVRMRFPGHEKVKVVKGVPEGWEIKPMEDITDVIDCLHTKKPDKVDDGEGWLLQLENIKENGRFNKSYKYMISSSDYNLWTKNIEVNQGDCLITNVGRIAAVAQIPNGVKAALGRNMTAIRPCKIPASFLIQYLLSPHMQEEVLKKQDLGVIMGALNVKSIKKLSIVVPSINLLNKFDNIVEPIRNKIWKINDTIVNLKCSRDLLLPRLISGKLDVEKLDIVFPMGMRNADPTEGKEAEAA